MMKSRKNRLRPIKTFDGKNKEECITWVDLNQAATRELSLPLSETMMDTAEGSVYEVLSMLSLVSEDDLIDYVLEAFSDIPIQEDAIEKLRNMRRKDEALISFNARYSAIHRRAYNCEPHSQVRESIRREYEHLRQGFCRFSKLPDWTTKGHVDPYTGRCNGESQGYGTPREEKQNLQRQVRIR